MNDFRKTTQFTAIPALPFPSVFKFRMSIKGMRQKDQPLFSFLSDLQTGPPNHKGITENTAIIAGVVAALVLLVALTLLAVYYINTHPTVAPPFYLMQVRKPTHTLCRVNGSFFLFKPITHAWNLSPALHLATAVCSS